MQNLYQTSNLIEVFNVFKDGEKCENSIFGLDVDDWLMIFQNPRPKFEKNTIPTPEIKAWAFRICIQLEIWLRLSMFSKMILLGKIWDFKIKLRRWWSRDRRDFGTKRIPSNYSINFDMKLPNLRFPQKPCSFIL